MKGIITLGTTFKKRWTCTEDKKKNSCSKREFIDTVEHYVGPIGAFYMLIISSDLTMCGASSRQ